MGAKGQPKSGGRQKGTPNKGNIAKEKAAELGIDPFEVLLLFAKGDWKALGYKEEKITVATQSGFRTEFVIQPSIRAKCAAAACEYMLPKLKAIEHSGSIDTPTKEVQVVILPSNGREKK